MLSKITISIYSFLVDLICLLFLIFFGILADEGVNINKFKQSYFLGMEINYQFLFYLVIFVLISTIMLQIIYFYQTFIKKI